MAGQRQLCCLSVSANAVVRVGVAGLGQRGRTLSSELRAAGFRGVGYDADVRLAATSGVRTGSDPEKLAREAELVVVAKDGQAAVELAEGLLSDPGGLEVLALLGNVGLDPLPGLAEQATGRGIDLLEAALDGDEDQPGATGGPIFAGGSPGAIGRGRPLLECHGRLIVAGPLGAGQVMGLANALLRGANAVARAEVLRLAQAAGAAPALARHGFLEADQSWSARPAARDDGAPARIRAGLALAAASGVAMPFLERLETLLNSADLAWSDDPADGGIVDLSQPESQA